MSNKTKLAKIIAITTFLLTASVITVQAADGSSGQAYVQGRVTDAQTSNPISNATVEVYDVSSGVILLNSTITDSNGEYFLEVNNAEINIGVLARAESYYVNTSSVYPIQNNETLTVDIDLNPGAPLANSTVKGYVKNYETNETIQNAAIQVSIGYDYMDITNSNSSGFYIFNLPSGSIGLTALSEGFFLYFTSGEIEENSVIWMNISLHPTPIRNLTICGYVTDDETMDPIEDIDIDLDWSDSDEHSYSDDTYTNSEGFYSINASEGFIELSTYHYQYYSSYTSFNLTGTQKTTWVNFSLNKRSTNYYPHADAGGLYSGFVNHSVQFNGSDSYDMDGNISYYYWDFGDGNSSTVVSPLHAYTKEGVYLVSLGVIDNDDNYDSDTAIVEITKDTEAPSKVLGLEVEDAKDGKLNLSWLAASDNYGVEYYNIYRDNMSITNTTLNNYQDDGLTDGQTYSYQIEAVDYSGNIGEKSDMFNETPTPTNRAPVANLSGPDYGLIKENIFFDGSNSSDPDNDDLRYYWDFGDGSSETTVLSDIYHVYQLPGEYIVTLVVADDGYLSDSDSMTVIIEHPNRTPEKPEIQSTKSSGEKNKLCTFTVSATDADGDLIKYVFDWGDSSNTTTDFATDGSKILQTHKWDEAGKFVVSVKAFDGENYSNASSMVFYVDSVVVIGEISGYLIDDDGDDFFDFFVCDETSKKTAVQLLNNGNYLINSDGDDTWDYVYDSASDEIKSYSNVNSKEEVEQVFPLAVIVVVVVAIVAAVVVFLFYNFRQKNAEKRVVEKEDYIDKEQNQSNPEERMYVVNNFPVSKKENKKENSGLKYHVDKVPDDTNSFDSFEGYIFK